MDYGALFAAGTYTLADGIRVFAGTVDDPFWLDLGGTFDTFNTHAFRVLSAAEDAALQNLAADAFSGFAVNAIAIEVPIEQLTATGAIEPASSPAATLGVWAATSRPLITRQSTPKKTVKPKKNPKLAQVQRMGNPLMNELLIGTGFKDRFSIDVPGQDSQFASFFLDPVLARVVNALTGGAVAIPAPPRVDLLPLVTWSSAGCWLPPSRDSVRPSAVASATA